MSNIDKIPDILDGARVRSTALPRGPVCSFIDGHDVPIAAYAIAKHDNEDGYYLFALNDSWTVVGDTYWQSLEEAKHQGNYEAGIRFEDWKDRE